MRAFAAPRSPFALSRLFATLLALTLLAAATSASTVAATPVAASRATAHIVGHASASFPPCRLVRRRIAQHRPLTARGRAKAAQCRRTAQRRAVLRRAVLRRKRLLLGSTQSPVTGSPATPGVPVTPGSAATTPATPTAPGTTSPKAPVKTPPKAPVKTPPKPPVKTPPKPPVVVPPVVVPTPPPVNPPPTTSTSTESWNGFGAGAWPDADWRPYADSSPFNKPVVSGTAVHPSSAQIVQTVLGWDLPGSLIAGSAGTSNDYGHPTYYAQSDDPIYTLHATDSTNAIEGMRIPIPAEAQPAGGGDGHMTIVTPDGWEYDLWQVDPKPAGGGTLTFAIGGRTRIDGLGLNSPATASNFANLAGVIRAQELAAGEIDHALFIVVKCTSTGTGFGYGTQAGAGDQAAYVYPASHGGNGCGGADNATAPPMGARFQLAMTDAQIAALNVPTWKKTIATALAHYGGYVGDTGGPGFGLQFESSTMYTVFGEPDPLVEFAQDSGISPWNGLYSFNLATGIDWAHYLRVVVPPA